MLRLVSPSRTATMSLAALAHVLAGTRAEELTERAYVVLEKQDLGEDAAGLTSQQDPVW